MTITASTTSTDAVSTDAVPPRPQEVIRRRGAVRRRAMSIIGRRVEAMILPILGGPVFFQMARMAVRLNLVGKLRERPGMTLAEIMEQCDLKEDPARILLLGCVSLKLLKVRRGKYYCRNRLIASAFSADSPHCVAPFVEWMHHIVGPSMRHFEEAMHSDKASGLQALPGNEDNLYDALDHDPELQAIFYEAMNARTENNNQHFLDRIDFSGFQRVLDVAGGDGVILERLARRHPQIRGTLLEIPSVAEHAERRFQEAGLSDRLTVVSADMFIDPFPAGHDCVLFCHVNPNHSQAANRQLLTSAFEALTPGGMVCIYMAFANNAMDGPLSSAMLSAYFHTTVFGTGRQYTWEETERWLTDVGFVDVTCTELLMNHGVALGRKL